MWRLRHLFNPIRYGTLSFQFISHRALRWTLAPLGLMVLFVLGPILAVSQGGIYLFLAIAQGLFYAMGLLGWQLEQKAIRIRALFVPFYFLMMNWSVIRGFFRYQQGKQTVLWERAARKAV
jgi:hypothetical protein